MKCQFRPLACEKCKSLVLMSFDVSFFSFFSLPLGLMSFDKFFFVLFSLPLQQHEVDCKFQPVTCDKCKKLVSKQKIDSHKSRECPQRIVKCEHCRAEMPQAQKTVSGCLCSFLAMMK